MVSYYLTQFLLRDSWLRPVKWIFNVLCYLVLCIVVISVGDIFEFFFNSCFWFLCPCFYYSASLGTNIRDVCLLLFFASIPLTGKFCSFVC